MDDVFVKTRQDSPPTTECGLCHVVNKHNYGACCLSLVPIYNYSDPMPLIMPSCQ